jgi:hypothetical protein
VALTSAEWDITDPAAAERFIQSGDVVINCAAYTKVDAAEDDQERAHAVNAVGPENVAQACARVGADLIHISTDYVFSGAQHRPYEIDDETGPLGVYGRTKLAGELTVLAAMPDAHIVRTAWVYEGADGGDFVAVIRRLAAATGRWKWSPTRWAHRPTSVTSPVPCCRSPTTDRSASRCCTQPTQARSVASSRPKRCSRSSAPIRTACAPSAPIGIRARAAACLFGIVRTAIH